MQTIKPSIEAIISPNLRVEENNKSHGNDVVGRSGVGQVARTRPAL